MNRIASLTFASAFAGALAWGTSFAEAAIIVQESFDYDIPVNGHAHPSTFDGGIGWDGPWYNVDGYTNMAIAPGLTFGDLAVSGNARGGHNADSRHHRRFAAGFDGTQDVWVGFLARNTSLFEFTSVVSLTNSGSDVVQLSYGYPTIGNDNWGIRLYGLPAAGSTTIEVGDGIASSTLTYFVLSLAYDNGETTVTLEAYTDGDLSSAAGTGSWVVPSIIAFDGMRVTRDIHLDEITIATTRAEVIPEPASLALIALGSALMLRRSR